jgi:hypothetical protein
MYGWHTSMQVEIHHTAMDRIPAIPIRFPLELTSDSRKRIMSAHILPMCVDG